MKKKLSLLLCLAMTLFVMTSSTKITTIFVIGDSTAAEKSNFKDNPERAGEWCCRDFSMTIYWLTIML